LSVVFDRYEIDSRSPDEVKHNIGIDNEFPQVVSGPKPFLNTFNQFLRFSRTRMVSYE
jgi:hypothetical protein